MIHRYLLFIGFYWTLLPLLFFPNNFCGCFVSFSRTYFWRITRDVFWYSRNHRNRLS